MVRASMLLLAVAVLASGCEIRKGKGSNACLASCLNRSCGESNGCGGYCTACPGSEVCIDAVCVEASEEACWPAYGECGWDGCGGWLGGCYADEYCSGNWCYSDDDWDDQPEDPEPYDPDPYDPDPYDPDPYDPDPYECEPDCSWGCGDDGCGGWCGDC